MFFKKVIRDGSVPLEYKRGKCSKKEYKSKCLSYKYIIPEGFVIANEVQLENRSKPKDICDFFGRSASGVEIGVNFIPADGVLLMKQMDELDMIGRAVVKRMNDTSTDGRRATYYGITEFCGKNCAHSVLQHKRDGKDCFTEFYQHYTSYYMLQFAFTYTYENRWSVEELKACFSML